MKKLLLIGYLGLFSTSVYSLTLDNCEKYYQERKGTGYSPILIASSLSWESCIKRNKMIVELRMKEENSRDGSNKRKIKNITSVLKGK